MKKIADYNPRFSQAVGAPLVLNFTCPSCGDPYLISVPVDWEGVSTMNNAAHWKVTGCGPDPKEFSWNKISVSPSINNHHHGRKKTCSFHATITNGEIKP